MELFLALERFDESKLENVPDAEKPAVRWKYLKKSVMGKMKRAIYSYKNGIRIPEYHYKDDPLDTMMETVFDHSDFWHKDLFTEIMYEPTSWESEMLYVGLEELMRTVLNKKEIQILELSYGLDGDKLSIKELSEYFKMSEIGIKKSKARSLDKLRNFEDAKKIIEKYVSL